MFFTKCIPIIVFHEVFFTKFFFTIFHEILLTGGLTDIQLQPNARDAIESKNKQDCLLQYQAQLEENAIFHFYVSIKKTSLGQARVKKVWRGVVCLNKVSAGFVKSQMSGTRLG